MNWKELAKKDPRGRTALFHTVETGDLDAVKAIVFKFAGTGIWPQRLALIDHKDQDGLTAIDAAEAMGYTEIAQFLRGEKIRMAYFE